MPDDGNSEEYYRRLVDEEALRAYLADRLGEADEYAVERHQEGHSNETLFVTWDERDFVVRRPPPGETADTAHDVLREFEVMSALQDTPVPLPRTVLACEDHSVLGSDFYVMERVEGDVLRDEEPDRFASKDRRRRLGEAVVDTLAAIHQVDYEAVGLGEFGHPPGYTRRQVRRWSEQFTWAFSTTAERREVTVVYDLMEWLEDNVPEDNPDTLVHGDYKLDNVMFGPARSDGPGDERAADGRERGEEPEIVGVFDWEMSTLGDPRTDLGWLLSYWRDPGDPEPVSPELTSRFMERPGYPSRRDLVDRWEDETGLTFEHERFYRVLAVYKLAALGEMFFARYLSGDSDDPLYPLMEERVPALAKRALEIVDGERPL